MRLHHQNNVITHQGDDSVYDGVIAVLELAPTAKVRAQPWCARGMVVGASAASWSTGVLHCRVAASRLRLSASSRWYGWRLIACLAPTTQTPPAAPCITHPQVTLTKNTFIREESPNKQALAVGIEFVGEVSANLRRNTFINNGDVSGRGPPFLCRLCKSSRADHLAFPMKPLACDNKHDGKHTRCESLTWCTPLPAPAHRSPLGPTRSASLIAAPPPSA